MTLAELLDALAERGSRLTDDGGRLRHIGPRFAEGDPIRRALGTFHDEVLWLLASARLCVHCPRVLADGDWASCAVHRSGADGETERETAA